LGGVGLRLLLPPQIFIFIQIQVVDMDMDMDMQSAILAFGATIF
jgi:hypothetical protein